MRTNTLHEVETNTPGAAQRSAGRGFSYAKRFLQPVFLFVSLLISLQCFARGGTFLQLATAPGGVTITAAGGGYRTSFGTMNGLAVGTPGAGLTATDLGNGALYFSEVRMTVNTILGQGYVTASFSTPFQHPAALAAWICPSNSSCNVAANYSALSTSGGVTNIVPPPGVNSGTTVTIGIAIFVPDNDGASAVTGNDNGGTITFTVVNAGLPIESDTLKLATSPNKIQSAVELTLDSDPSGLTINPATDYSVDYGNVNGLGIGAGAGLTAIAQAGGAIYSTPYRIKPAFSDLRSTTGTITVCTQTAFAHSAILNMQDASASAGPFTAIPNCGARVQITNTASDRSTITRYLGLFISKVNGPGTSFASDSAVLTYTITVP